jgi:hypothetical protein
MKKKARIILAVICVAIAAAIVYAEVFHTSDCPDIPTKTDEPIGAQPPMGPAADCKREAP